MGWRAGLEPPAKGHHGLEQVDWARPWRRQHSGLTGWCHPDHGPGDERRKDLFSFNKIYFSFGRQLIPTTHLLEPCNPSRVHATRNPEAQSKGIISPPCWAAAGGANQLQLHSQASASTLETS